MYAHLPDLLLMIYETVGGDLSTNCKLVHNSTLEQLDISSVKVIDHFTIVCDQIKQLVK